MKTAALFVGIATLALAAPASAKPPLTRDQAKANADFLFDLADSNRDGKITRAEFQAYLKETNSDPAKAAMFDMLDADHDGIVTKAEAEADAFAKFDRIDTNHDGVIDVNEMAAAKAARAAEKAAAAQAAAAAAAAAQPAAVPTAPEPAPTPPSQ